MNITVDFTDSTTGLLLTATGTFFPGRAAITNAEPDYCHEGESATFEVETLSYYPTAGSVGTNVSFFLGDGTDKWINQLVADATLAAAEYVNAGNCDLEWDDVA